MAENSSFWDHLDALRGVLLRMVATVVPAAVALFCFMPWIFDNLIMAPCRSDFPLYRFFDLIQGMMPSSLGGGDVAGDDFTVSLINTSLAAQFFTHLSLSFQLAFVLTVPMLLYWLWTFVAPALYARERRYASGVFIGGIVLFYLGAAVAYFLVFPLTLRFLAGYQLSADIPNTITLESYIDNFMSMLLVMGLTFEMPLLCWALGRAGIITRSFFARYRRHAIVALVIAAAIITPTSDPFTLLAVFLPLYLLWELSCLLVSRKSQRSEL